MSRHTLPVSAIRSETAKTAATLDEPWQNQIARAFRTPNAVNAELQRFTHHRVPDSAIIDEIARQRFSFKVTPYMLSALRRGLDNQIAGTWQAFERSFAPTELERQTPTGGGSDAIGEQQSPVNPVPAITNFYKNRVLFRITTMCAAYCRYCFRRRMVGDGAGAWDRSYFEQGMEYISQNREIREVIFSGGDPLILSDQKIRHILARLSTDAPHVRRARFDTKMLTMIPQRFTPELVSIFREFQPVYIIGHFTHPYEITEEVKEASGRLIDAGVMTLSHTPLLRGINDDEQTLATLFESLVDIRIKPYYLLHYIPTEWTEHFRVPIAQGMELMRQLHARCDGLALPTYIVYLPDSGGKVPVAPSYVTNRTNEGVVFQSMDGRTILYPEP